MAQAVSGLWAFSKRMPAVAPGHAGENKRAKVGELADPLAFLKPHRAARNKAGLSDRAKQTLPRSS